MRTAEDFERVTRRRKAMSDLVSFGEWYRKKDAIIREAAAAGIGKQEIADMIGIHRSTVYDILARPARCDQLSAEMLESDS